MMDLSPVTLSGRFVRLVPLALDHVPALWAAGNDADLWRWTLNHPRSEGDMRRYVQAALEKQAARGAIPFATTDVATGAVIGSTRFHNIEPAHRRVEIGYTWIGRRWQRTPANTEAKYLMLRHAFETWHVQRVSLKTDARNARSRAAIERLGARFDGVLRAHSPAADRGLRDTAYYSILDTEWPPVREGLVSRLGSRS
jgi:RimJ/RimL family protein N-acetyltransferase